MKYKAAELTGALLDLAVAKAEGWGVHADGDARNSPRAERSASTDWAIGGPIIERERRFCLQAPDAIEDQLNRGSWSATILGSGSGWCAGPTPLIAAMRAYVVSKLGEELDL